MIPKWIERLDDDAARQVAERIAPVLEAAAERVHYTEGRRGQYIAVAAGLFAGAIAMASIADLPFLEAFSWSIYVLAAGFFLLSVFLFYVYSQQINRYPFTSATNTWKWFYRNALPEEGRFSLGLVAWLFRWRKEEARVRAEFDRQLPQFSQTLQQLVSSRESLWQDVQQLYVLHVNEKYKNVYLSKLRSILNWGLVATIFSAAIAAAAQPYFERVSSVRTAVVSSTARVVVRAEKASGSTCGDDCWLANIDARNYSQNSLLVEVRTNNSGCLIVPGATVNPFYVAPASVVAKALYLRCFNSTPASIGILLRRDER